MTIRAVKLLIKTELENGRKSLVDRRAWKAAAGIWKRYKINGVAYQRKIRAEADKRRGV